MTLARRLLHDQSGSSTAEFTLLLPLLIILLFGVIDGGRLVWTYNEAEKAAQEGARTAVVVDPVAGGLASTTFAGVSCGGNPLKPGDTICATALPDINCTNTACSCTGCPSGLPGTYNSTAFNEIVARMQAIKPDLTAAKVEVHYSGSGLGFVGDPTGPSASPLVTVRIRSLQFKPVTGFLMATIDLPGFNTTLTGEDLIGNVST